MADAKKKGREAKKRDSPQAQDHQEKWGERLMNLPCTWTERKKKKKKRGWRVGRKIIKKSYKKNKKRKNDLPSVQWQIRGEE